METTHDSAATVPTLILCELADASALGVETFSPFCLKVHRALRAKGLAYQRRHGREPASFRELNPASQVPVLLVGDEPVADSTAILRKLEELPGPSLLEGLDGRARAEALLWEELADTAVNGFLVAARWADDENWPLVKEAYFGAMPWPVKAVVPGRIRARVVATLAARDVLRAGPAACWARFEVLLDQLEARAPEEGFWVGARLSVADVALFGQLQSFRTALTPRQARAVESRSRLRRWLDRVNADTRPAS